MINVFFGVKFYTTMTKKVLYVQRVFLGKNADKSPYCEGNKIRRLLIKTLLIIKNSWRLLGQFFFFESFFCLTSNQI